MGSLRLILIRHCETVDNAAHIVQGQTPGSLSDKGRKEALEIARKLDKENFDAVYSSDLARSFQTAAILMKSRKVPPIIPDPRLREQNFGIHEGKPLNLMLKQMLKAGADFTNFDPKQGESAENFQKRINGVLENLKKKHLGQTVVLVTHYGVINYLLFYLLGGKRRFNIGNGMITIINIDQNGQVTKES